MPNRLIRVPASYGNQEPREPGLPIHDAARDANVDALQRELASGVAPNVVDPRGRTPLMHLCGAASGDDDSSRIDCLNVLIDAGANPSATETVTVSGNRMTPLLCAVSSGTTALVAALLDAGADVNCHDGNYRRTVLHYATLAEHRNVDCAHAHMRLLVNAGANVDVPDNAGQTALDFADWYGSPWMCPALLRAGATIRAESTDAQWGPNAYIRKVRAAGGIRKYERTHLNALVASFAPKFSHLLPPEMVRRVVEYAFHVGDY